MPLDNVELFGFLRQHHGPFGKQLLKTWKLPASYAEAAQYHGAPDTAPGGASQGLLACHLGNLLAKKIGFGTFDPAHWDTQASQSAGQLRIELAALLPVEKEVLVLMKETNLILE